MRNKISVVLLCGGLRVAHVFLSYKREDAARVRKLLTALRSVGLDVWWDEDIPPSAPWEATIEKALADAKAVIVCWSPASVASENVRSEARVAREDGRLIQVLVKPCSPPLFFGERQAIDLSKWRGNGDDARIAKLVETVRKLKAGESIEQGEKARRGRPPAYRASVRQRVTTAAMLFFVLLAGGMVAYRGAVARQTPKIAVLPFEDLSPTHDKSYFAEGVAEEILSSLSSDKAIKVLGRTSARQIDRDADPVQLRKSLGITDLLEGSARTAGDALRVDVRLVDTRDGTTVWHDQYQGRLSEVFAFQDKIASAVVQHLHGLFSPVAATTDRPVTTVNVYDTYLAARSIMRKRSEPTLKQAMGLAQQVIATDPKYAPGEALYAELVWLLSDDPLSYGTIPVATAKRVAEAHAREAIRLAPNLADGYAALGLATLRDETSIVPLRRAIALDPSRADDRVWLQLALTTAGRYDEALQVARDAAAMEPLWPLPLESLVESLTMSGQQAAARVAVEQYRARGGNQAQYYRLLFLIDLRGPDLSSAVRDGERAYQLDRTLPDLRINLMDLYYLLGLEERAPTNVPQAFIRLRGPFYRSDSAAIDSEIRNSGARLWQLPDADFGFFHLAAVRDWTTLNRLYDARPAPAQRLCVGYSESQRAIAQALIPALRAAGRQRDAQTLLVCLSNRLQTESHQKARSPAQLFGDYEYDQATVAAFAGDRTAALSWLEKAVARGWLGRPYSPNISDRPQFYPLRSEPRLAVLQAKIDGTIAQQRAQVLAHSH